MGVFLIPMGLMPDLVVVLRFEFIHVMTGGIEQRSVRASLYPAFLIMFQELPIQASRIHCLLSRVFGANRVRTISCVPRLDSVSAQ